MEFADMEKEWEENFHYLDQKLSNGKSLYRKLCEFTTEGVHFLILPEHMGDSIYVVSLAQTYKEQNNIDVLYLVCKVEQKELMCNFRGIDGVVSVSVEEMDDLKAYMNVVRPHHPQIRYAHFSKTLKYVYPKFEMEMNFRTDLTVYESALFWLGLSKDAKPCRMIPFDNGDNDELKEMFKRSILLFPKAQSDYGILAPEIFEIITDFYIKRGYDVYTNYNGFPYEHMIHGSKPLSSSMKELATIAPYFSQVISVRSGAVDLLAQCGANLSVLYDCHSVELTGTHEDVSLKREEVLLSNILDLVDRSGIANYQVIPGREKELLDELICQAK